MSQFPPAIYPLSVFKTCNNTTRTVILSEWNSVKCYGCYSADTLIYLYIGEASRQITVYGLK